MGTPQLGPGGQSPIKPRRPVRRARQAAKHPKSHTNGGHRYGEPTRRTSPKHDTEPLWAVTGLVGAAAEAHALGRGIDSCCLTVTCREWIVAQPATSRPPFWSWWPPSPSPLRSYAPRLKSSCIPTRYRSRNGNRRYRPATWPARNVALNWARRALRFSPDMNTESRRKHNAAYRAVEQELGLSRPDVSLRWAINKFIGTWRGGWTLLGVVDRFPVEVGLNPGGEGRTRGFFAKVTLIGLPPGLQIQGDGGTGGWGRRRWRKVDCGIHHKWARATDTASLEAYLTNERIAAICGDQFVLHKQHITCPGPAFARYNSAEIIAMVRKAVRIAHALRANHG